MANAGQVRLRIRALRRSVVRRILAANAIDAALIAGALLAAIACMRHLAGVAPLPHPWPVAVLLVALLAALLRTARQWPDLATTARLFDAAASSRDRIGTALALDGRPNLAPMERVALAECARFTREFNPRPHLASRCPRRAAALLVPLASAGIICWDAAVRRPTPEATPGARAAVHRVADVLEDLSRDLASTERRAASLPAHLLDSTVAAIRGRASSGTDPVRSTMAELSMLERRLEEISADPPTPSLSKPQLEALAATLERHEATRGAASALRAGDLGTAARRLRQAISESQDAPALAAELSRPDGALSAEERDQLLASLHGDTDPAPVSLSANAPARGASLQTLAERLGAQAATADDGRSERVRPSISPLLASIEMLRSELQDAISSAWTPPGIRASPGRSTAAPPPAAARGGTAAIDPDPPTGQPGTDADRGTTRSPFDASGARMPGASGPGIPVPLPHQPATGQGAGIEFSGRGESRPALTPYREAWERAAAEAEGTIVSEEIPLGARLLVRRYFLEIRPGR